MSARNLVLLLMFGSLIYGGYYLYRSHTIQPLQAELISIDTTQISQLRIHPRQNGEKSIQLQRAEDYWIASNGQVHLRALRQPVEAILRNLIKITTIDIAGKSEDEWLQYGLGSGQGTRVEIYQGSELVEDFWVGNTVPDSSGIDSLSFIRNHLEQEVYLVQGLSSWPFRQSFVQFRPKNLLMAPDAATIDSFAYQYPDTIFLFQKVRQGWYCNGDSIENTGKIEGYLNSLRRIESTVFVDDYDNNLPESERHNSLMIYPSAPRPPIMVDVFKDTLRQAPYLLHSNQNPTTWFGSDSNGVYRQLFPEIDSLLSNRQ